jgi:hypothetical protein
MCDVLMHSFTTSAELSYACCCVVACLVSSAFCGVSQQQAHKRIATVFAVDYGSIALQYSWASLVQATHSHNSSKT